MVLNRVKYSRPFLKAQPRGRLFGFFGRTLFSLPGPDRGEWPSAVIAARAFEITAGLGLRYPEKTGGTAIFFQQVCAKLKVGVVFYHKL